MGAFLSYFVLICTSIFLYDKIMVLVKGSDVTIIMNTIEGAFTDEDTFSAEQGFFFAAALTEYDSNTEIIEEARYGELIVEQYGWGDGNFEGTRDLDYHYCTDEELGITPGPNTEMFPIFEKSTDEFLRYRKKFKCVDPKDRVIWGDYSSART